MKKYLISFVFVFIISFGLFGIRAYAYPPNDLSSAQLQTALDAFKNRIDSKEDWKPFLEDKTLYYTIFHDSSGYAIYMDTERPIVIPSGVDGNPFGYDPALRVYPQENGNYNVAMWINHNGTYTLPNNMTTGDSGQHDFWKNPDRATYYTSYPIYNDSNVFVRGSIPIGTKYCPTNAQVGGPSYVYDPVAVPTPSNLRVKMILPTGLFPKIKETQVQTTWTPSSGALHMEISLFYNYKNASEKISKLMPYITYSDALFSSVGVFTKLMNTDLETFIHSKNSATTGQTFANGKLNLTHYYARYVISSDSGLSYGNWVKVDLVTGGTDIVKGNVVSKYNEVYENENGDEIEVTDGSEYNGIQVDNSGNVVDPKSLTSLQDYLMAIPNLLGSFFSAINSLIASAGSFGVFFTTAFGFLPPVVSVILVASIFAVVVVGLIKLFK